MIYFLFFVTDLSIKSLIQFELELFQSDCFGKVHLMKKKGKMRFIKKKQTSFMIFLLTAIAVKSSTQFELELFHSDCCHKAN